MNKEKFKILDKDIFTAIALTPVERRGELENAVWNYIMWNMEVEVCEEIKPTYLLIMNIIERDKR